MSSGHWSKRDLLAKRYVYFWVDLPSLNASVTDAGTNRWSPATPFKIFENKGCSRIIVANGALLCCEWSQWASHSESRRIAGPRPRRSGK
jgi:hypothetical protein